MTATLDVVIATPLFTIVNVTGEPQHGTLTIASKDRLLTSVVAVVIVVDAVAPETGTPSTLAVKDTTPAVGAVNVALTETL